MDTRQGDRAKGGGYTLHNIDHGGKVIGHENLSVLLQRHVWTRRAGRRLLPKRRSDDHVQAQFQPPNPTSGKK
jgi:hypothetical protein